MTDETLRQVQRHSAAADSVPISAYVLMSTREALPPSLDTAKARELTDGIRWCVEKAYQLLYLAHERKAWAALGYPSFGEYVSAEFDISRSRAYQLLNQARVVREISAAASTDVDIPEAVARDLGPVLGEVTSQIRERIAAAPPEERDRIIEEVISHARSAVTYARRVAQTRDQLVPAGKRSEQHVYSGHVDGPSRPSLVGMLSAMGQLAEWMTERPLAERPRADLEVVAADVARVRQPLADMEADLRLALATSELDRL